MKNYEIFYTFPHILRMFSYHKFLSWLFYSGCGVGGKDSNSIYEGKVFESFQEAFS
jgi:hypothetical protein